MVIKKLNLNKRTLSLIVLLVILAAVSFINYKIVLPNNNATASIDEQAPLNAEFVSNITEEEIMSGSAVINNAFFTEYRTLREQTRSENISILEDIANSENKDSESVINAQNEMIELVKLSELELITENQIKSKGFSDCIIFIHEDYANVLVDSNSISPQEAAQIQDIINKNCKIDISKISISTSKNN